MVPRIVDSGPINIKVNTIVPAKAVAEKHVSASADQLANLVNKFKVG